MSLSNFEVSESENTFILKTTEKSIGVPGEFALRYKISVLPCCKNIAE